MNRKKEFILESNGLFNEEYYTGLDEFGVGGIATPAILVSNQPTIRTHKFDSPFTDTDKENENDLSYLKNVRIDSMYEMGDPIPTLANYHLNTRELGMVDMIHPLEDEGDNRQKSVLDKYIDMEEATDITPEDLTPSDTELDYYDDTDGLLGSLTRF